MTEQGLKEKTIASLLWKFSERLASHLVTFIVTIILARLLLPNDYGIVALAMVFVNIANVFISSGLNTSLIQKKDVDNIDYSTIFYATVVLSVIIYLILYAIAPYFAELYDNPEIKGVLRVLGLILPLSSFNAIQQANVSRNLNFKYFFFATLSSATLAGLIGVILAYCNLGVWALVGQQLSNITFNTISLYAIVKWHPLLIFSWKRFGNLFTFGANLMIANFIGAIFNQLRNFVVGTKYTPTDLAFLTTGDAFPSIISNNIDASINSVLFPALSKVQNSKEDVKRALRRAMMTSSYIVNPALLFLMATADNIVLLLLTEKWIFSVPYIRILSFGYCIGTLAAANLQAINAIGRSDITLKLEFFKKPFFLIIILVTMYISPMAIAIGTSLYNFVSLAVNLYPNKKLIDYGLTDQLKDVLPQFILSIIVSVFVYVCGLIIPNLHLAILIQLITGISLYILLSKILHLESYEYIMVNVKQLKDKFSKNR